MYLKYPIQKREEGKQIFHNLECLKCHNRLTKQSQTEEYRSAGFDCFIV